MFAEGRGGKVHAGDFVAIVGHPPQRDGLVHHVGQILIQAERLEAAHRRVVDRHGAGARVDRGLALESDRLDPVMAQAQRGGKAGWAHSR